MSNERPGIERYWPRLRREAHDLYREVAELRGEIRKLERALAQSDHALALSRTEADRLREEKTALQRRLAAIERSRGWRIIRAVRRLGRHSAAGTTRTPDAHREPVPMPKAQPTAAQRWAEEARRRAAARANLQAWIARARTAGTVIAVAGGPDFRDLVSAADDRRIPAYLLEGEGQEAFPAGIEPSLVPDLLSAPLPGRRIFVATQHHTAIRWMIPAQQAGWLTVYLDIQDDSPPGRFLRTDADAVVSSRSLDEILAARQERHRIRELLEHQ